MMARSATWISSQGWLSARRTREPEPGTIHVGGRRRARAPINTAAAARAVAGPPRDLPHAWRPRRPMPASYRWRSPAPYDDAALTPPPARPTHRRPTAPEGMKIDSIGAAASRWPLAVPGHAPGRLGTSSRTPCTELPLSCVLSSLHHHRLILTSALHFSQWHC